MEDIPFEHLVTVSVDNLEQISLSSTPEEHARDFEDFLTIIIEQLAEVGLDLNARAQLTALAGIFKASSQQFSDTQLLQKLTDEESLRDTDSGRTARLESFISWQSIVRLEANKDRE